MFTFVFSLLFFTISNCQLLSIGLLLLNMSTRHWKSSIILYILTLCSSFSFVRTYCCILNLLGVVYIFCFVLLFRRRMQWFSCLKQTSSSHLYITSRSFFFQENNVHRRNQSEHWYTYTYWISFFSVYLYFFTATVFSRLSRETPATSLDLI